MKLTLIILFLIPALSIGVFYWQKQNRVEIQGTLQSCKDLHMECVSERDYLLNEMQEYVDTDFKEYYELKEMKEKYLKADELVAKAIQVFFLVQGLRMDKEKLNWAYDHQKRQPELKKEWEVLHGVEAEEQNINDDKVEEETETTTQIEEENLEFSEQKNKTLKDNLTQGPLKYFWNKRFKYLKNSAYRSTQNKLRFLKGRRIGIFTDNSHANHDLFFELKYKNKGNQPKKSVNIFMDSYSGLDKKQAFHLSNTFSLYKVRENSKSSDFYILKNKFKGIELHIFHLKRRKTVAMKIYVPEVIKEKGKFKVSKKNLRVAGEAYINLKGEL